MLKPVGRYAMQDRTADDALHTSLRTEVLAIVLVLRQDGMRVRAGQ